MTPEERNELRMKLLKELYEYNFEHSGFKQITISERDEIEKHRAYEYLQDKGLIVYSQLYNGAYNGKITSRGIDLIETGGELR